MKLYLKLDPKGQAQTIQDIEYRFKIDPCQAVDPMLFQVADSVDQTSKPLSQYVGATDFVLLPNFGEGCVHVYIKGDSYHVNDGRHKANRDY